MAKEFVSYVDSLRKGTQKKNTSLNYFLIRFIEAGKISDAITYIHARRNNQRNRKSQIFSGSGKINQGRGKEENIFKKSAESAGTKG